MTFERAARNTRERARYKEGRAVPGSTVARFDSENPPAGWIAEKDDAIEAMLGRRLKGDIRVLPAHAGCDYFAIHRDKGTTTFR